MTFTDVGSSTLQHGGTVHRIQPRYNAEVEPRAGDLWTLAAFCEPGVTATGPAGWTQATRPAVITRDGRQVEVHFWWHTLTGDEQGWPEVVLSRSCFCELELRLMRGAVPYRLDSE